MFKKLLLQMIIPASMFLTTSSFAADNFYSGFIKDLPTEKDWIEHAHILEKYWMMPEAYGTPIGKFPTWRCNDGTLRNGKKCADELKDPEFLPYTKYDYVRMISRQTFGYGALFNLTGNAELLRLHLAGVEFLLDFARDPDGGFYGTFNGNDTSYPKRLSRTPQDLAYALVGLAMNAYITNDPEVIKVIVDTQKYIYDTYYDKDKNMLKWVIEDSDEEKSNQEELVAQLDQLNAYMLLTWRVLPKKDQEHWTKAVKQTISMINDNFYDQKKNKFIGCLHDQECFNEHSGRHTDYGHSVKTFWMEHIAASILNDQKLLDFSNKGIKHILKQALAKNNSQWFGSIDKEEASWWIGAELNQSALSLALDKSYKMPNTLYPWLNDKVDKKYGELDYGLKTHLWRNAFHSTEHALVGYITTQGIRAADCKRSSGCLRDNEVDLYFAPSENLKEVIYTPYLYSGDVKKAEFIDKEYGVIKVTFENISRALPIDKIKKHQVGEINN